MKIEKFRGMSEEEIKDIPYDKFLDLIDSRNRRTLMRLSVNPRLKAFMKRVDKKISENKANKIIKTHIREAIIMPRWLGLTFGIHNGKEFKKVEITIGKIGKRLGEFSHTTSRVLHHGPGVGATRSSKFVPLK